VPRGNPAQTRQQLIDAGVRLAHRRALTGLTVDDVVGAAGVAKGTFYLHFRDRAEYFVTLHRRFHDDVMKLVQEAILSAGSAGTQRLLAGSLAYLDGCRRDHPVKALLIEARVEPAIQAEVARQNARFAKRAALEFAAAGWPAAEEAARLWVGLVAEAALAEAESGAVLPGIRDALARFLHT
jgi:AcrR family transcriptional regulator